MMSPTNLPRTTFFSILETHTEGKYIVLDEHWQSTVPDLFFIGTNMQSRDRRAASGFIHGFRYNVRTLCNMLGARYDGDQLSKKTFKSLDAEELSKFMIGKFEEKDVLSVFIVFDCKVAICKYWHLGKI